MSIVADRNTRVVIQGGPAGVNAARRMSEFCHLIKSPLTVQAFVFPPDAGKTNEVPYGGEIISVPVYKTVAEARHLVRYTRGHIVILDRAAKCRRKMRSAM